MENQEENSGQNEFGTAEKLTFLLIGGGIGAIAALLFAPKPGRQLRGEIADVSRKGLERGRETAHQIGERAGEYYEIAREKGGEYYETSRDTAAGLYYSAEDVARNLAEKTREAAEAPRNNLTAAIEAGKAAYFEEKRRSESAVIAEGRPVYPKELGESPKE